MSANTTSHVTVPARDTAEDRPCESASASIRIFPIHFHRTFSLQRLGPYDPTTDLSGECFRKAFFYRTSPSAIELCRGAEPGAITITTFSPHARQLLDETIQGLTQNDAYASFTTEDSGILRLHHHFPGLRVLRFPWLYDSTCSVILQQRIRTVDAMRDWRRITSRYGSPAPLGLRAFPPAETLAAVPRFQLESMNIDARRGSTLLAFARENAFVPLKPSMDFQQLRKTLQRVSGIGPWTTESVLGHCAGDTDAAIPGDLHLPRIVCYALAGEFHGSDGRMMELLEPFRGHRYRIMRLISSCGIDVPW